MPSSKVAGSGFSFLPLSGGTLSSVLDIPVGSGSAPSLRFAGFPGVGVYCYANAHLGVRGGIFSSGALFPSNGIVAISASAASKLVLNGASNIGVVCDLTVDGKLNLRNKDDTASGELNCAGGGVKEVLLASVQINLNITTKQNLYTVPAGKSLIVTKIVERNASATVGSADGGFGCDASASDWIMSDGIAGLAAATAKMLSLDAIGTTKPVYAATSVFGWAATAPEGVAATAYVDVFGYLI